MIADFLVMISRTFAAIGQTKLSTYFMTKTKGKRKETEKGTSSSIQRVLVKQAKLRIQVLDPQTVNEDPLDRETNTMDGSFSIARDIFAWS